VCHFIRLAGAVTAVSAALGLLTGIATAVTF
jgi:hypothetical protein